MINLKATSIALLIIGTTLLSTSCGKKGCTDVDATNYSSQAKKDNETCRYAGSNVFWIHDSSAQKMAADGIQSFTVYVDDEIVGSQLVSQSFTSAPACGQTGIVTVTKDLFSAKNKAISYRVVDDQSIKRWAGVIIFNGNTCENFELVYFQ